MASLACLRGPSTDQSIRFSRRMLLGVASQVLQSERHTEKEYYGVNVLQKLEEKVKTINPGQTADSRFKRAFHLATCCSTCIDLRRLARTLVELKFMHASRRKFLPFGHPRQVDISWSQVMCISVKFTTFCDLAWTCDRQVRDRRWLASPFGQGFMCLNKVNLSYNTLSKGRQS